MSYQRVIPRDLFNESSLLKCYGKLWLLLEDNPIAGFTKNDLTVAIRNHGDCVDSFEIVQRASDGSLFIENLPLFIGEYTYRLTRPLNSRDLWPLYAERIGDPDFEEIPVFTDDGDLTPEMQSLIAGEAND